MAPNAELTRTVDRLEERVSNNIWFFRVVAAALVAWMGFLTNQIIDLNKNVRNVVQAQANSPLTLSSSLLAKPAQSSQQMADRLGTVSALLASAKRSGKPDPTIINKVADQLSATQAQYGDLPQTWQATSALINYKSRVQVAEQPRGKCTESGADNFVFKDCDVRLEDVAAHIKNVQINGQPMLFTFINCTVHYAGGAIPSPRMAFYGSTLQIEVFTVPLPQGRQALEQLTKADLSSPVKVS